MFVQHHITPGKLAWCPIVVGTVFAASALTVEHDQAGRMRAVLLDGTAVVGNWLGSPAGRQIELQTSTGLQRIEFENLSMVVQPVETAMPAGNVVFYLADGGRLRGDILSSADDAVVGRTSLGTGILMPFDALAAVQFVGDDESGRCTERFRESMQNRLASEDVLITRSADDPKKLRGRLERLDADRGLFVFAEHRRTIRTERIFGIVLATGAEKPKRYPASIRLGDGSVFSGHIQSADDRALRVETSLKSTVEVPIETVACINVHSARVVYLSDLPTASQRVEGRLHRPWPPRQDQSVTGRPLSIAGNRFDKGLGVHSRTELTYDLDSSFATFLATIGLDDAVRPRGSVVFRVLGDGSVLFGSGEVTGCDPPRDVVVGVSGIRRLTLVVDYGAALDLADHADWGNARLLRPAGYLPTR